MTLKVKTPGRHRDRIDTADGRREPIGPGRVVPDVEETAHPAVGEQAAHARGRKAKAPTETDAEPESTVCAAYWAY